MTANRLTPYAKAVAIEQYLSNTYTYSLEKPTHPSRNEDFVSHFLFVDRTGYCDHFSTAMVVMLRSVGVPARWVKGFAPGTRKHPATTMGSKKLWFAIKMRIHGWRFIFLLWAGYRLSLRRVSRDFVRSSERDLDDSCYGAIGDDSFTDEYSYS